MSLDRPRTPYLRVALGAAGVHQLLFGLGFLLLPGLVVTTVGARGLEGAAAMGDVRSVYGGYLGGVGAFLVMASVRTAYTWAGGWLAMMTLVPITLGRVLGLALDDVDAGLAFRLLLIEGFALALVSAALAAEGWAKRQAGPPRS